MCGGTRYLIVTNIFLKLVLAFSNSRLHKNNELLCVSNDVVMPHLNSFFFVVDVIAGEIFT